MKRKYYVCEATVPSKIYTETEKCKSQLPGCRFGLIGELATRTEARATAESFYVGNGYVLTNNDGENVYVDAIQ